MKDERMYVITRRDLPKTVATVQSIHAAIEVTSNMNLRFSETPWVIVYGVDDEPALHGWAERLHRKGVPYTAFREPDMENQMTAIAYWGRKFSGFGGLRLL